MPSLGGQKRHAGYCEWNPQAKTLYWMQCVNEVLEQYRDYWPLTIRQIFYRLVANYGYEKDEKAYGRLINYLGRARRAHMIPFHAIRDDGAIADAPHGYTDVTEWCDVIRATAKRFNLNRMDTQPTRLEIYCEAAGMVPLLANAVYEYGVPVYSGGGFNSLTAVKDCADRIEDDPRDMIIFNFGDYDPSGESIFESFRQDVEAFVWQTSDGAQVRFDRVALTEDQVDEMGIPTAPPKSSDSRSKNWIGDTAQLEAIPPDELAQMAVNAVEAELDLEILDQTKEREARISERLVTEVEAMLAELGDYDGSDEDDE